MAAVAPARFICVRSGASTERLTLRYLFWYSLFNTGAVAGAALAAVLTLDSSSPETASQFRRTTGFSLSRSFVFDIEVPAIAAAFILSIVAAVVHWRVSLVHLFRARSR